MSSSVTTSEATQPEQRKRISKTGRVVYLCRGVNNTCESEARRNQLCIGCTIGKSRGLPRNKKNGDRFEFNGIRYVRQGGINRKLCTHKDSDGTLCNVARYSNDLCLLHLRLMKPEAEKHGQNPKTIKHTIDDCHEFAAGRGGLCLSTEYINGRTHLKWMCQAGHQFEISFRDAQRYWCTECTNPKTDFIVEANKLAKARGGVCISTVWVNGRTHLEWICSKDHIFSSLYSNVCAGCWCPYCNVQTNEEFMIKYIDTIFPNMFTHCRPPFMGGLELDYYSENLSIAFEYNGKQHYEHVPFFHREADALDCQRERDTRKLNLAAEHNVDIVIIPYTITTKNKQMFRRYMLDNLFHYERISEERYQQLLGEID